MLIVIWRNGWRKFCNVNKVPEQGKGWWGWNCLVGRGVAMGGGGLGGHMPPKFSVPHSPQKIMPDMLLFVNIARVLILCTPTKFMLIYSYKML